MAERRVHQGDPDRLFAVPITEYLGCFRALDDETRKRLQLLGPDDRLALMQDRVDEEDPVARRAASVLRTAVSELEAWECVERVRGLRRSP